MLACAVIVLAGCGSVEVSPSGAINDSIAARIESASGNQGDWKFENDCAYNGSCSARLALAAAPEKTVATNRYVARDSRAFLKGEDEIAAAIASAYSRNCLDGSRSAAARLRCIGRDYDSNQLNAEGGKK